MFVVFFWIAAMMHLLVLPEGRMQRRPGMLEMKRIRCAPHIKGIKGGAARHPGEGNPSSILFRRVGSPGYGEGSSQGQKGAAFAVYGGWWWNPVRSETFSGPHGPLTNKENIPLLLRA
jgi:hypothetical protein